MDWYHKKQFDYGCADKFRSAFVSLEHALSLPAGRAEFNGAFASVIPAVAPVALASC